MEKEEYGIAEKKVDPWLVIILIFLGWLGIDKFYYAKSFKKAWKFALVKLAYTVVGIGIFWNIYDIIKACMDKYEFDFRDYFR
jgi:NhaP-type Na+/H+ or K+/H+ antiporter